MNKKSVQRYEDKRIKKSCKTLLIEEIYERMVQDHTWAVLPRSHPIGCYNIQTVFTNLPPDWAVSGKYIVLHGYISNCHLLHGLIQTLHMWDLDTVISNNGLGGKRRKDQKKYWISDQPRRLHILHRLGIQQTLLQITTHIASWIPDLDLEYRAGIHRVGGGGRFCSRALVCHKIAADKPRNQIFSSGISSHNIPFLCAGTQ
jgi:hypothetical protein